ncbi:unnamed protein product [Leuciscus chuanchicus]
MSPTLGLMLRSQHLRFQQRGEDGSANMKFLKKPDWDRETAETASQPQPGFLGTAESFTSLAFQYRSRDKHLC